MSFKQFNLSQNIINSLYRQKYFSPTKIQSLVIPKMLKGANLVIRSETGTGKSHSYIIPIIEKLERSKWLNLQKIIISPTNELAIQIFNFIKPFKQDFKELKIKLLTSGKEEEDTSDSSINKSNIVVATPRRIVSLIKKGVLNISSVNTIVLDEADMLLELGYFDEIDFIIKKLNSPQIIFLSASIKENLKSRISKYIGSDFVITTDEKEIVNANVDHYLIDIHHKDINYSIEEFIKVKNPYFLIIFASNKTDVNKIYFYLKNRKYNVCKISGELSDRERKNTLKNINNNLYQIIIASDLLSRGININDVSDVLSVDLPYDLTYYHHRAGRTGRYNKKGNSYIFYNKDDISKVNQLIKEGIAFKYLSLKDHSIVESKPFINKINLKKKLDSELIKEIKKIKIENKNKKIKPCYKKKIKVQIQRAKNKHRRKLIKQNIRKQRVERYKQEAKKL